MNRLLFHIFFWIFLSSGIFFDAFADSTDFIHTSLSLDKSSLQGVTHIFPEQLDALLLGNTGVLIQDISAETYYSASGLLIQDIQENIHLSNNQTGCTLSDFSLHEGLMMDEIRAQGFPISYQIHCPNPLTSPTIDITLMGTATGIINVLDVYHRDTRILHTNIDPKKPTLTIKIPDTTETQAKDTTLLSKNTKIFLFICIHVISILIGSLIFYSWKKKTSI